MWRHAHRGGMRGYEHVYSSAVLVVAAVADAACAMSSSGAGRGAPLSGRPDTDQDARGRRAGRFLGTFLLQTCGLKPKPRSTHTPSNTPTSRHTHHSTVPGATGSLKRFASTSSPISQSHLVPSASAGCMLTSGTGHEEVVADPRPSPGARRSHASMLLLRAARPAARSAAPRPSKDATALTITPGLSLPEPLEKNAAASLGARVLRPGASRVAPLHRPRTAQTPQQAPDLQNPDFRHVAAFFHIAHPASSTYIH